MADIKQIRNQLIQFISYNQSIAQDLTGYPDFHLLTNPKNQVGRGKNGNCFKSQLTYPDGNRHNVCLKQMKILEGGDLGDAESIVDEIKLIELVQKQIDIPTYAIEYFGFFLSEDNSPSYLDIFIVMEFGDMSLQALITQNMKAMTKVSFEDYQLIFCFLVDSIYHLEKSRIVQRDLKPDNILVFLKYIKEQGVLKQSIRNVKICDYGEAELISKGLTLKTLSTVRGTLKYMPPEIMYMYIHGLDETYVKVDNFVCDIFSLGIIILYLGFAQMVFPPQLTKLSMPLQDNPVDFPCPTDASLLGPEWLRQIWENNLAELVKRYPEVAQPQMTSFCNLIRHMLVFNAAKRITPKALLALYTSYQQGGTIPPPSLSIMMVQPTQHDKHQVQSQSQSQSQSMQLKMQLIQPSIPQSESAKAQIEQQKIMEFLRQNPEDFKKSIVLNSKNQLGQAVQQQDVNAQIKEPYQYQPQILQLLQKKQTEFKTLVQKAYDSPIINNEEKKSNKGYKISPSLNKIPQMANQSLYQTKLSDKKQDNSVTTFNQKTTWNNNGKVSQDSYKVGQLNNLLNKYSNSNQKYGAPSDSAIKQTFLQSPLNKK